MGWEPSLRGWDALAASAQLAKETWNFLKSTRTQAICRHNYASVAEFADKVVEVLDDQSSRGQALKSCERISPTVS